MLRKIQRREEAKSYINEYRVLLASLENKGDDQALSL